VWLKRVCPREPASDVLYRRFVHGKARWIFERFSAGDYEALLKNESPDLLFEYPGRHALGTTLTDINAVRLWYERFFSFFPDIEFTLENILMKGGPRKTTVVVEWAARATMPDGQPYDNQGIHILIIKMGKAAAIRVYLDTQKKAAKLQSLAEHGVEEAGAPPIKDAEPAAAG
jgi:ketosteroid isomerase-like protein